MAFQSFPLCLQRCYIPWGVFVHAKSFGSVCQMESSGPVTNHLIEMPRMKVRDMYILYMYFYLYNVYLQVYMHTCLIFLHCYKTSNICKYMFWSNITIYILMYFQMHLNGKTHVFLILFTICNCKSCQTNFNKSWDFLQGKARQRERERVGEPQIAW